LKELLTATALFSNRTVGELYRGFDDRDTVATEQNTVASNELRRMKSDVRKHVDQIYDFEEFLETEVLDGVFTASYNEVKSYVEKVAGSNPLKELMAQLQVLRSATIADAPFSDDTVRQELVKIIVKHGDMRGNIHISENQPEILYARSTWYGYDQQPYLPNQRVGNFAEGNKSAASNYIAIHAPMGRLEDARNTYAQLIKLLSGLADLILVYEQTIKAETKRRLLTQIYEEIESFQVLMVRIQIPSALETLYDNKRVNDANHAMLVRQIETAMPFIEDEQPERQALGNEYRRKLSYLLDEVNSSMRNATLARQVLSGLRRDIQDLQFLAVTDAPAAQEQIRGHFSTFERLPYLADSVYPDVLQRTAATTTAAKESAARALDVANAANVASAASVASAANLLLVATAASTAANTAANANAPNASNLLRAANVANAANLANAANVANAANNLNAAHAAQAIFDAANQAATAAQQAAEDEALSSDLPIAWGMARLSDAANLSIEADIFRLLGRAWTVLPATDNNAIPIARPIRMQSGVQRRKQMQQYAAILYYNQLLAEDHDVPPAVSTVIQTVSQTTDAVTVANMVATKLTDLRASQFATPLNIFDIAILGGLNPRTFAVINNLDTHPFNEQFFEKAIEFFDSKMLNAGLDTGMSREADLGLLLFTIEITNRALHTSYLQFQVGEVVQFAQPFFGAGSGGDKAQAPAPANAHTATDYENGLRASYAAEKSRYNNSPKLAFEKYCLQCLERGTELYIRMTHVLLKQAMVDTKQVYDKFRADKRNGDFMRAFAKMIGLTIQKGELDNPRLANQNIANLMKRKKDNSMNMHEARIQLHDALGISRHMHISAPFFPGF
jgi:hypothetical protein